MTHGHCFQSIICNIRSDQTALYLIKCFWEAISFFYNNNYIPYSNITSFLPGQKPSGFLKIQHNHSNQHIDWNVFKDGQVFLYLKNLTRDLGMSQSIKNVLCYQKSYLVWTN